METEYPRIKEVIELYKKQEKEINLNFRGKELLIELETLMDYVHSSLKLEEKETLTFEGWLKDNCRYLYNEFYDYKNGTYSRETLYRKYKRGDY